MSLLNELHSMNSHSLKGEFINQGEGLFNSGHLLAIVARREGFVCLFVHFLVSHVIPISHFQLSNRFDW